MKKCPFCAEEIQNEAIKCRFCGSDLPASTVPTDDLADVRALARSDKIGAIKLLRERTGVGLSEAKEWVETPDAPPPQRKAKTIRETKATCSSCGKIWYYGKTEALESAGAALQNAGKSMMCCTGCVPAVVIPDKKVVDLNRCPTCGSKAVTKESVEHEVL